MVHVPYAALKEMVYNIYISAGAVEEDAQIVSDHLCDSNLLGHDSHGVMRTDSYIDTMKAGPSAERMETVRENTCERRHQRPRRSRNGRGEESDGSRH